MGIQVDSQPLITAQREVASLVVRFNQLQRIAGFALAALGVGAITESADTYTTLSNRLKAVTTSAEEFARVEKGVFDIADKTSTPVEDQAAAYQRFATRLEALNLSTEDTLDFQLRLSQGLKLSGATAQETSAVLIQLGQGMGNNFKSGGQEINSLVEQAGSFATELAKAIAGPEATASQLKEMAKQGKLTGKAIVDAVRSMGTAYDQKLNKRVRTFAEWGEIAHNVWMRLMRQIEPAITSVSGAFGDLVGWVKAYVEDGSAVNSLIAALAVAVTGLAIAFAPLVASLVAAAAPWALFYLIVQDFVTFLRGGRSVVGQFLDYFGVGSEKARQGLISLFEKLKEVFAYLKDRGAWNAFVDVFKKIVDELSAYLAKKFREALGDTLADKLGVKKTALTPEQKAAGEEYEYDYIAGKMLPKNRDKRSPLAKGLDAAAPVIDDAANKTADWLSQGVKPMGAGEGSATSALPSSEYLQALSKNYARLNADRPAFESSYGKYYARAYRSSPPAVTNNITVQGNADAQTAREIGKEAGKGTSSALGRDRSAIGAGFVEGSI